MAVDLRSLKSALRDESGENKFLAINAFVHSQLESKFDCQKLEVGEIVKLLSECGLMSPLSGGDERKLREDDFVGVSDNGAIVMNCIKILLNRYIQLLKKDDLLPVIILCSQYAESSCWANRSCIKSSEDILMLILTHWKTDNIFHCLVGNEEDTKILKKLFKVFASSLTSANWKYNPAMMKGFHWCLFQIQHPFCAEILDVALPLSLLFVDDYVVANRICGIRCLHHILNNTPAGDLQRYDRTELIYSALKNIIYHKDPKVINVIYPCILKILSLTKENPLKKDALRQVNKYDFLLNNLLKEMNMEETIALRSALSNQLPLFVDGMGLTIVRHLKKLVDIVLEYLEVYDDPQETTRLGCLDCLKKIITVAQPRIEGYLLRIVKGIIRLLYVVNFTQSPESVKVEIKRQCLECLKLLHRCFPSQIDEMCKPLLSIDDEIPSLKILSSLWTSDNAQNPGFSF
ncbi:TEL2-interacting protein 2 [Chamberlinius hualienensis]